MSNWWTQQQLKSGRPETRRLAIQKLAASSGVAAIPDLVEVASDADREVRLAAIQALGQISDRQAIPALAAALRDSDSEVREAVVSALQQIGEAQAIGPLTVAMRDSHGGVRWRAAKALAALGWQPGNDSERVNRSLALGEFSAAAKMGASAVEPMIQLLKDRQFTNRRATVETLAQTGDVRVAPALIAALKDPDPHIRVAAAEAFTHLRDPHAVEPLAASLRDNDHLVRAAAATTLGKMDAPEATPHLIQALADRNWSVRKAAVEALGRLKDARGVEPLTGLLKDPDHDVREAAVGALGQLGDPGAIEGLVISLADAQSTVRKAAAAALRKIDEKWERSTGAQRAIPSLQAATQDKEYWVRHAANYVLQAIQNAPTAEAQPQAQPSASDTTHFKRLGAVEALLGALRDYDRDFRLAAAEALGRIGDPRSIPALAGAQADEDVWVRAAVGKSLKLLGWKAAPTPLPGFPSPRTGRSGRDKWGQAA